MVNAKTIKESVKLADVLSLYGSPLNGSGRALCPFHNDKRPSMTVKGERWKCWSCGESGDAIDFVMKMKNCGVPEAMETLNRDFHLGYNLKSGTTRKQPNSNDIRAEKVKAYREYLNEKKAREIEDLSRLHRVLYRGYVRGGCIGKEKENECRIISDRLDKLIGTGGNDG